MLTLWQKCLQSLRQLRLKLAGRMKGPKVHKYFVEEGVYGAHAAGLPEHKVHDANNTTFEEQARVLETIKARLTECGFKIEPVYIDPGEIIAVRADGMRVAVLTGKGRITVLADDPLVETVKSWMLLFD